MTATDSSNGKRREGAWVAYYEDWSDVSVFRSEVAALRHAIDRQMGVVFVPFGSSVREVAAAKHTKTPTPAHEETTA